MNLMNFHCVHQGTHYIMGSITGSYLSGTGPVIRMLCMLLPAPLAAEFACIESCDQQVTQRKVRRGESIERVRERCPLRRSKCVFHFRTIYHRDSEVYTVYIGSAKYLEF